MDGIDKNVKKGNLVKRELCERPGGLAKCIGFGQHLPENIPLFPGRSLDFILIWKASQLYEIYMDELFTRFTGRAMESTPFWT